MGSKRKKDKLYYHQALFLIIVFRMMLGLTYLPSLNTPPANQDVWIMLLLSVPYTIIVSLPLLYLGNKFSQLNLLEYTEKIMGKFLGRILGIFYALVFLGNLLFFSSVFIEILDTALYPQTPTIINTILLLTTCAYIVNKGLTNLARLGELVIPSIVVLFFVLTALGFQNYHFNDLLPIFSDSTFGDINKGALFTSLRYIDILILAMIIPYLGEKKDINKLFFRSLIYSNFIVILSVLATQTTLGVEYAKRVNFPYYNFTRLIKIGETQGFDLLYVVSWIIGNIIKISGYLYFTTIAFGKVTNRRNQIFIIPVAIVAMIAVVFIKDNRPVVAARDPFLQILYILSIISIVIIPLIVLIVYFFRRKTLKKIDQSKRN